MWSLSKFLPLLAGLCLSGICSGQDILLCESDSIPSFYRSKCTIQENELLNKACLTTADDAAADCVERVLKVAYTFVCKSQDPHAIGITSGSREAIFAVNGTSIETTGYGPFVLKDLRPSLTKQARFFKDCRLEIKDIKNDISSNEVRRLKEMLDGLISLEGVLQKGKDIATNVSLVKSLLVSLNPEDTDGIVDLLKDNLITIKETYSNEKTLEGIDKALKLIDEAQKKRKGDPIKRSAYESALTAATDASEQMLTSIADRVADFVSSAATRLDFAALETHDAWATKFTERCEKILPKDECKL